MPLSLRRGTVTAVVEEVEGLTRIEVDGEPCIAYTRLTGAVEVGDEDLRSYAAKLDLDVALFDTDRTGTTVLGRVARDVESGDASGEVQGTPTLFIDGVVHRGGYDAASLLEALTR